MKELQTSEKRMEMRRNSVSDLLDRRLARWAVLPLRLIVGYGFIAHGLAKLARGPHAFEAILQALGVPEPPVMAWSVILIEVLGGLAVILGGTYVLLEDGQHRAPVQRPGQFVAAGKFFDAAHRGREGIGLFAQAHAQVAAVNAEENVAAENQREARPHQHGFERGAVRQRQLAVHLREHNAQPGCHGGGRP